MAFKNRKMNITRLRLLLGALVFISTVLNAQIPPGYYDPASGKTGVALQAALHNIIKDHTVVSYSSLIGYFATTDAKPNSVVWDMYSDMPGGTPPYVYHYNSGDECGNYSGEGDCYNREHSWPQSWFNEASPMKSDLFHLYPTDGYVNGRRSNYPYGTVSGASWTSLNGSKVGPCTWPGYSGTVFEPLNEYKGDFARTYFYMSTRYYTEDASWEVTDMTNKSQLKPWALQMMLHWSNTDPVSTKEINRNNAVYGIQDNRNPFIDHPEYAALIWGNPVGEEEATGGPTGLRIWPVPAEDYVNIEFPGVPDFGDVAVRLVSAAGRVHNPVITRNGEIFTLSLRDVPDGVYMVQVAEEAQILRGKVVKVSGGPY